jgi:hypothetical protein
MATDEQREEKAGAPEHPYCLTQQQSTGGKGCELSMKTRFPKEIN